MTIIGMIAAYVIAGAATCWVFDRLAARDDPDGWRTCEFRMALAVFSLMLWPAAIALGVLMGVICGIPKLLFPDWPKMDEWDRRSPYPPPPDLPPPPPPPSRGTAR